MNAVSIECPQVLDDTSGRKLLEQAKEQKAKGGGAIALDFSRTESMDARGAAWIVALADYARAQQLEFTWRGQTGTVADYVGLIEPGLRAPAQEPTQPGSWLQHFGDTGIKVWQEAKELATLLVESIYWTVIAPFEGRGFRWGLWMDELYEMGVRAIRINFIMNFLLGLTIAMMSAAQLREFGLGIYVANLVMIGFCRELAAIMTAVVISARTGAAIAAELATMKVQEEIDALRGMGLHVPQFLVAPKLLALVIVQPCLTAIGMLAGVLGGMVWGVFVLEINAEPWLVQTRDAVVLRDVSQGMFKSIAFAIVIVLIGCHNGLRVQGGSRGVGLMTTRAVVMDIFAIVVIDMLFALLFYYVID